MTLSYTGSVKVLCRTAPWAIEVGGEGERGVRITIAASFMYLKIKVIKDKERPKYFNQRLL